MMNENNNAVEVNEAKDIKMEAATKKYEFTGKEKTIEIDGETVTLHQIRATKDFGDLHKGDVGGWIERESNLSQEDSSWVDGEAIVMGHALVDTNSLVCGNAVVKDHAIINDYSHIYGKAVIKDYARIINSDVHDYAVVKDYASVSWGAEVYGNAHIESSAAIYGGEGEAKIHDNAEISGNAKIIGANISGDSKIGGAVSIDDYMNITGHATIFSDLDIHFEYDDEADIGMVIYTDSVDGLSVSSDHGSCSLGIFCSHKAYWSKEKQWYDEIPVERRRTITCRVLAESGLSAEALSS